MHDLIVSMGNAFTPEQYLFWTRIQCIAWTAADLFLLANLIRIANLCRRLNGTRNHLFSWVVLIVSVPFAILVLLAPTGASVFLLELLVTVPHFLLILYLLVANVHEFPAALRKILAQQPTPE